MRPFQTGKELLARIVCAKCPAEKRMKFDAEKIAWTEIEGGKGKTEPCPFKG